MEDWGYKAICLSASSGMGLEDLAASLKARVSVTAGPSGVGKSSLINAINAQLSTANRTLVGEPATDQIAAIDSQYTLLLI